MCLISPTSFSLAVRLQGLRPTLNQTIHKVPDFSLKCMRGEVFWVWWWRFGFGLVFFGPYCTGITVIMVGIFSHFLLKFIHDKIISLCSCASVVPCQEPLNSWLSLLLGH